jgi:hypothetical protein
LERDDTKYPGVRVIAKHDKILIVKSWPGSTMKDIVMSEAVAHQLDEE